MHEDTIRLETFIKCFNLRFHFSRNDSSKVSLNNRLTNRTLHKSRHLFPVTSFGTDAKFQNRQPQSKLSPPDDGTSIITQRFAEMKWLFQRMQECWFQSLILENWIIWFYTQKNLNLNVIPLFCFQSFMRWSNVNHVNERSCVMSGKNIFTRDFHAVSK